MLASLPRESAGTARGLARLRGAPPSALTGTCRNMRKFAVFAALAVALAAAGCNTISGAGKDVSSAGTAVSDTAQDAKPHS